MDIVETPIFTRQVVELLSDDSYRELQSELIKRPDLGQEIIGSGGLRKVRWSIPGRGKRGGIRVIYYWYISAGKLLMLYMYQKTKQEDLTAEQVKLLRHVVEEEYR
jgi:mRNA-degrading endonuclease RelE of RelBE toxin-antitoxin system